MPFPDHIEMARVPRPPQARRKTKRYVPRNPRHSPATHAPKLEDDAQRSIEALLARKTERPDFDPKLMLRFELNRRIPDDAWRSAGLTLLDSSDRHAAVAFAARADLERFRQRLGQYAEGPRERPADKPAEEGQQEELPALFEDFYDAIDELRALDAGDRVSERLRRALDEAPDQIHEYDVELWFHSDPAIRDLWLDEARALVSRLGGEWVDQYVGTRAAVVLSRVRGGRDVALGVAELDQVSLVDAIPAPALSPDELAALQDVESLPDDIPSPSEDAPVVGMIDTGVRAGHPMIRPAIVDVAALDAGFGGQGEDAHGHGTAVAGLLLFGDVLACVRRQETQAPFWLASVRVLDDAGRPPANRSWIASITEAIVYLAEELECRVINLSFGDSDSPYRGGKSTPLAAELDTLARRYRLLLVVSAGNIDPSQLVPAETIFGTWPRYLTDIGHQILDPAQSAIALTVGAFAEVDGLTPTAEGTTLGRYAIGRAQGPAPFSRSGPGVRDAIKPEVVATGGNWVFDESLGELVSDPAVEIVSTSARYPNALFGTSVGTSLAAPAVAHIAGRLQAAYPGMSANALRALIAQSAVYDEALADYLQPFEEQEKARYSLCGYGTPRWDRAGLSTPNRVVLFAEDAVRPDAFHVYRLPMTECFTDVPGPRALTVAVAFDPPVRHRRFDYLAFEMDFLVVRGIDLVDLFELSAAGIADPEGGTLGNYEVKMRPTRTTRSKGTLQVGSVSWSNRLQEKFHDDWYIVVRSFNKWMGAEATPQNYALTATLSVDRGTTLYAELEADVRLELEARARVQI